jgi:hypothetical protein
MHADDNFLVLDTGERVGPFSSHWAACAAMIRQSDPNFISLGGDKESDLKVERAAQCPAQ